MAIETFTVRDLRERTGELTQDAEAGQLALVTKRGRPLFVAVPFTEELLREGVGFSLAVDLYRSGMVTAARGALLAGMDLAACLEELSALEVPVADYPAEEVADELAGFE
ncbi:type II toxin-antitoxin system prevent-host-death family antitoxin [Thiohalorhabdus sp.]|uniref:type II toxin-antitoxin system prevent-host-death family antitoxin n=1 Tax=Thiohalorhabdus sp. TaxID=3094134 RepID=UPI002FC3C7F0